MVITDKKMFIPVFISVAVLLVFFLFFAMPGIKEYYLSAGQKSTTSDIAFRYNNYLAAASTRLFDLASHPAIKNINPSGEASPDLSPLGKELNPYFSDCFLFNSTGEMESASGNRRVLSINSAISAREPGGKDAAPFPVMLTELSGSNFPAVVVPLKTNYGQRELWLAGSLNPQLWQDFSAIYTSGAAPVDFYLADREGNLASLSSAKVQKALAGPVRTLLSATAASPAIQLESGGMRLVSSGIGETGWSVVSIRRQGLALSDYKGNLLKITLLGLLLSAILMMLSFYYIRTAVKPVNSFIENLSRRFEAEGRDRLESISSQIDAICNNMNLAESIPIGIMVVDPEGVIKFFNREAGEITGHNPSGVIGKPMLKYFPHNYYHYTMECLTTGREYLGLRNIIKSGNFFKELLLNINPLYSHESLSGAVATFQDVSPQRKMIEVHAAYALAKDLASQRDLDSTVQIIARAASELVEIEYTAIFLADRDGILMISSWHGIPDKYVEKYNSSPYRVDSPEIKELYKNKTPLIHGDVRNKHNLKAMLILPDILSFYSFPVVYEDKTIGLVNLYSTDKNKLSKDKIYLIQTLSGQVNTAIINFYEFQKMRLLASMDGLTGLFNKKYFLENLEEELKQATAECPLSLAILDLDYFKNVNDTYGHQAGDQVIKEIAGIMANALRETDSICRFGGEEIAISMPGTSRTEAHGLIDSIRGKIDKTPVYQTDEGPLFITVSGGVATYPADGSTIDELILNSDSALYSAKRAGRNLVVSCSLQK